MTIDMITDEDYFNMTKELQEEIIDLRKQVIELKELFVEVGDIAMDKDTITRLTRTQKVLRKARLVGKC